MDGARSRPGLPRGVWILAMSSAIVNSGFGMVVPLIPVWGNRLGASHVALGLLVGGFFFGRLAAQIPAGIASDRFGRKRVLLAALIGYTATCTGFGIAQSAAWLVGFRLLQGASSAFFTVAARSAVNDMCGASNRGAAQGVLSSSVNLGFVTGPLLGALLADGVHITAPFWITAFLCAITFAAILPIPIAAGRGAVAKGPIARGARDIRVWLLATANFFFLAGMSAIMTLFPIAGEARIPGGIKLVGVAFTAAGLCGMIAGPAAGRLSDRVGRPLPMLLGAFLSAAEGASLLLTGSPLVIGAAFGLGGLGAASFSNGMHALVGDLTSASERGTVTGAVGAAGEVGGMVGSILAAIVWRATDLAVPFSLQVAFAIAASLTAAWLLRVPAPRPSRPAIVRETIIPG